MIYTGCTDNLENRLKEHNDATFIQLKRCCR
ncbi:MAG: hypothetical protein KKH80_01465 [Candidatus Omnitrophica bacterium]|nr:hypothetical protein [Candidatus Omnitrophota bacterium]